MARERGAGEDMTRPLRRLLVGLLVLAFVVMNIAGVGPGGGGHGPGRHRGGATTDAGHVSSP